MYVHTIPYQSIQVHKLCNRLTRRPCKGDEFEILILEAKRQDAGICRSRQKLFATWTFISIGRRVTQEWKFAFRLRGDSILLFKGPKKNIRNLWFSIIRIISGRHSLFQFFPLLDASGARALVATQKPQSATRQRCDAMSSCRPKCTFFCALFFVEHRRRSPFFQVFPCSIHLLSTSNNGSIGFIPQTTSKMISLSLSKDILFVVDLGQLEPFVGTIFDTTDSMCNACIFRNVKEVLVRDVNTPPPPPLMIIRQHAQRVHLP